MSSDIYVGQEIGSPDCFVFCLENSYHLAIVLFFRMALFLSKVLFLFLGFFYLTAKPRSFFLFKTIYNLTKYIKYSPLIYSKICYTWLQSISVFFVLDFFFSFYIKCWRVLLLWAFYLSWNWFLFYQDCTLFSTCFLFCDHAVFLFVLKDQLFYVFKHFYVGQEICSPDCFVFCIENSYHLGVVLFLGRLFSLAKYCFYFFDFLTNNSPLKFFLLFFFF